MQEFHTYLANLLEGTGLAVFIYYSFKALKQKISGLESLVDVQKRTLETMHQRLEETERIGGIYKSLIRELPQDIENFKTILSKTKDETIIQLKNDLESKNREILEVQERLQETKGISEQEFRKALKITKIILGEKKDAHGMKTKFELLRLCEYNGRKLEQSVMHLLRSENLEEFISKLGYQLTITDDKTVSRDLFHGRPQSPDGGPVYAAEAGDSMSSGWHVLVNDYLYISTIKGMVMREEFAKLHEA